jgi:hypothetical protein
MVMPSGEKRYFTMPRMPHETDWDDSSHYRPEERKVVEDAVGEAANLAHVTLFSAKPEIGWETKAHSRDGKYWPCAERTQGARPVWIWAARR